LHVVGKIFRSVPWWGVTLTHSASMFGTYLLLTQLPTYMKEILKFDIKSNGGLSSLPYIVFWLVTIVSSGVGDKLIQSKKMSKTGVRKLFNTIGLVVPAVAMVGLAFVTCANPYMGVALLTLGLGATGCAYGAGFIVNYNDIAGSYAGLSFGIANTFGTVPGIIAPYLVGLLTTNVSVDFLPYFEEAKSNFLKKKNNSNCNPSGN
jgi:ACS family sodium-dependent inorganic phosphate cotransporter-like MFS transporter 5